MANDLDLLKPPTDKQETFLRVYVETGDSTRAAAEAGYANPDAQGRALRRNVNLVPLIRRETHLKLQEHVPTAINILVSVMKDEKAAAGVRVDAAKAVLDRAGYVVHSTKNAQMQDKRELSELSIAELQATVRDWQAQLEASLIDVTPSATDPDPLGDVLEPPGDGLGDVLEGNNAAEFRGNHAQVIDPLE